MNKNIEKILHQNFEGFLKLVELGVIGKELGTEAVINSKLANFIYLFAKNIKGANIEKLEDGIIETQNIEWIYQFAKNIKGANIEKLEDKIIKTQNAVYIYYFAKNIKGANIEKLEDGIIKTQNAEYICYFAEYVKGANIEKLEDGIIETQDAQYIYYFARNINGANKKRLKAEIKKININNKIKKVQEAKLTLNELMDLLIKAEYKEILNNKEAYSQLFMDDNQSTDEEMTRTLEVKNVKNE